MAKIKISKSSMIGVLIIYYMLMDGYFPLNNSASTSFFYWTKFGVALIVIFYSILFCRNRNEFYGVIKRITVLFLAPWLLMLAYSIIIWNVQNVAMPYITRGISNFISNIIPFMLGAALIKLYGERIIRLSVYAICLMAITNYLVGISVNGPIFILQLFDVTIEEAIIRRYKELHEIAYIAGLLLIYYVQNKQLKIYNVWIVFTGAVFFFAWKRIGILGILIAFLFVNIFKQFNKKSKWLGIYGCGVLAIFLCVIYVSMSSSDALASVLEEYGINMMGRDVLYSYFRRFCEFSLSFLGNGIGFVSRQFEYLTWADVGEMSLLKQGLHNDLFTTYLEVGMIGYLLWLYHWLLYIPQKIYNEYGLESLLKCFSFIIFTFVTYTTDNTFRYYVYQLVFFMLIIVACKKKADNSFFSKK